MIGPRLLIVAAALLFAPMQGSAADTIAWRGWSADLFSQAKAQKRLVLLDLEAVWCHWCHVMEEITYRHPEVVKLIKESYIPVRADQDANPDLGSRYADFGWPATVVFDADGTEIVKIPGFIPPLRMASILHAIVKDPSPDPSVRHAPEFQPSVSAFLSKTQRAHILDIYEKVYDTKHSGWGKHLKFLHPESLDYALDRVRAGDTHFERRVRASLDAALALIDGEWGGIYQYSHKRDWSAPHYEKIMWYQAQSLRLYAEAHALFGEARYLTVARGIARYLKTHLLAPEGAFYASQDADVDKDTDGKAFYALTAAERGRFGRAPRIDKNLYARENGWAVSGLIALYNVTHDRTLLETALTAARWALANRRLPGGGFSHGKADRGGPFLGDTLAMGRAALDLYGATGGREWLKVAAEAADFMAATFKNEEGGFITSKRPPAETGVFLKPFLNVDENIRLAHFANLLHRVHGAQRHRDVAEHAMRYLTSEAIAKLRRFMVGVLGADEALAVEPAHITIVGRKDDPKAQALHAAARRLPLHYRRLDWWDKQEGPLPNPDVEYPELEKAAAFACANQICSLPVFEPDELPVAVQRMMRQRVIRREAALPDATSGQATPHR
ncbi:MAG: DUF255 domain-containing protein [Methyloligellaceae bacterium]